MPGLNHCIGYWTSLQCFSCRVSKRRMRSGKRCSVAHTKMQREFKFHSFIHSFIFCYFAKMQITVRVLNRGKQRHLAPLALCSGDRSERARSETGHGQFFFCFMRRSHVFYDTRKALQFQVCSFIFGLTNISEQKVKKKNVLWLNNDHYCN